MAGIGLSDRRGRYGRLDGPVRREKRVDGRVNFASTIRGATQVTPIAGKWSRKTGVAATGPPAKHRECKFSCAWPLQRNGWMAGWLVKFDGSLNLEFHRATIPDRSHDNRQFQSVVTADFCRRRADEGLGLPRQRCSGMGGWSGGSHDRSGRVEPRADIAEVTARGEK